MGACPTTRRCLVALLTLLSVVLLVPIPLAGQTRTATADEWIPARTSDGQPDISGIFTFRTLTPLSRPTALKEKATLSPEEAATFEASERERLNRDLFDPEKGQPSAGYQPRSEGGVLSYNEFWYERGVELTQDKRTSLVVDPPDGRVPYTAAYREQAWVRRLNLRNGFADSYTDRSLSDRCIMGFNSGPPMVPGSYNNNVQILQAQGYVAIVNEMVHNARIVPLDGRPHGSLRQWAGDSRGHWEGNTLVVETINFLRETSLAGSTADTHLVERFRRIDADTVMYEFTVKDQNSYSRPWTATIPLRRTDGPLYEYACHEGNIGLYSIMAGARNKDTQLVQGAR